MVILNLVFEDFLMNTKLVIENEFLSINLEINKKKK